jgi:hypothetical protein
MINKNEKDFRLWKGGINVSPQRDWGRFSLLNIMMENSNTGLNLLYLNFLMDLPIKYFPWRKYLQSSFHLKCPGAIGRPGLDIAGAKICLQLSPLVMLNTPQMEPPSY